MIPAADVDSSSLGAASCTRRPSEIEFSRLMASVRAPEDVSTHSSRSAVESSSVKPAGQHVTPYHSSTQGSPCSQP